MHDSVAGDLGDDRGGGDREAQRVALDDRLDRAWQGRRDVAVDQRDVGHDPERGDGAAHRQQAGAQDVDAVDLAGAGSADANSDRADFDAGEECAVTGFACLAAQHLRIVEIAAQHAAEAAPVEDHRGGDDRPGERSAPRLVDAAHQPGAAALDREIRHRIGPPQGACATRRRCWQVDAAVE